MFPVLAGDPWTVLCRTGENTGDGTDDAVELILYGDKGRSKPVVIGADKEFRFMEGHTDKFDVSIGYIIYKV